MRRIVRFALLGAIVALVAIGTVTPAQSLNPPTWTWVVNCSDDNGANTTETLGTTLPSGVYLVTAEGACVHTPGGTRDLNVGTPCSLPFVGTVPCTTVTTINNTPGFLCPMVTGLGLRANACDPSIQSTAPTCFLTVLVNGQCLTAGTVGLVTHTAGGQTGAGMHAQYWDSIYGDNSGAYVVTATLTAL